MTDAATLNATARVRQLIDLTNRLTARLSEESKVFESHRPQDAATALAGTQDLAKAIALYERGIAAGDDWSAFFRGFQYETGEGAEHNMADAVRLYRMAAEQGHTRALTRLGILHMNGNGVERDLAEARRLLERAAPHSELARNLLARVQEMEAAGA